MNEILKQWNRRLGRKGTIAVGLAAALLFCAVGGPVAVGAISARLLVAGLFFALAFGPAAWVFADATKRGLRRPFLWALFALAGNVIGLVVYLLVRDAQPTSQPCGNCGQSLVSNHAACPWCGTLRQRVARSCPRCRGELDAGWRFCPYCRTEVGSSPTSP